MQKHRIKAIGLALFFLCQSLPAMPSPQKPNIIIFFTDDAGYADFGFQGNQDFSTPNIDRLSKGGVHFTNAYVTASVCSPSRAGMLTGRYQQRFGHEYNLPGMPDPKIGAEKRGLPLSEVLLSDLLKRAGYATGLIGKWHLGRHENFHPTKRGFDEFFGMVEGGSSYKPGSAKRVHSNFKKVDYTRLPYLTDAFGDEAAAFVQRHKDQPFFLYLSFNAPHTPMQARPDYLAHFRKKFKTEKRAINAAMTKSIDENVGKVLMKLEEHRLLENTLIFFTNDNGGAMPYNASLNAPLRGTKGTCLEGGNRVPFIVHWPAQLPGNLVYDKPISTLDILPTTLAAAGQDLPQDRSYDGVDLLPYLKGDKDKAPHDLLFWKLNWGAAVRFKNFKLVRTPADEYWLFDLASDISETRNIIRERADVAAELRAQLEKWEATLPEPGWVSHPRWREHSLQRYDQETVDSYRRN